MTETATPTRHERVASWIADPANVSTQQRVAVEHPGDVFLNACPGSGKTRTVGVRLAWWSVNPEEIDGQTRPRRTAALSYTNVAVDEIAAAAETAGAPVTEPDFLGTLHRFLLRYVVRPFGMKCMGCREPPRLVVDPRTRSETVSFRDGWVQRDVSIWDLHYRADGSLVLGADADVLYESKLTATEIATKVQHGARKLKEELAAQGLMSFSDAMYWAQRALEDVDDARAVAARFDEIVVDEAQDTMDTQVRCLQLLKAAGLRSLVVIGDPNQAIYGFAGAEPARLEALVAGLGLDRLELTENWRSSQQICNSAVEFCERAAADQAVGPLADLAVAPELIIYEAEQLRQAVEIFERRLGELELTACKVAVLCRTRGTRDALNGTGGGVFKGRLADLAELAHAVQQNETIGAPAVQAVEAELLRHAWPEIVDEELDETQRVQLRTAVCELASRLPETALTAKEWCKQAREATTATIASLTHTPATPFKPRTPPGTGALVVADLVSGRRGALRARTIHTVKGESYDATLTVATTTDYFNNVADWLAAARSAASPTSPSHAPRATPRSPCRTAAIQETSLRSRHAGFAVCPKRQLEQTHQLEPRRAVWRILRDGPYERSAQQHQHARTPAAGGRGAVDHGRHLAPSRAVYHHVMPLRDTRTTPPTPIPAPASPGAQGATADHPGSLSRLPPGEDFLYDIKGGALRAPPTLRLVRLLADRRPSSSRVPREQRYAARSRSHSSSISRVKRMCRPMRRHGRRLVRTAS
jgi:DNA helicase II / ATP-dependent DNA helicase PcrA